MRTRTRVSWLWSFLGVILSASAPAATLYVDGSVSVSGDGTSWEAAFQTIQEGIDEASEADTVIVAEGIYTENIRFDGKNIVLTSVDPSDPAMVGNTIIDGNGIGSVLTFAGTENETCVLAGFTIRNGNATEGGGICGGGTENHARAAIRNNTITGNSATRGAGIARCAGAIAQNTIIDNAAYSGGGLYECHGRIEQNSITGNSATGNGLPGGGGLSTCGAVIQGNEITGNFGCAISGCGGTIQKNRISGNHSGGVYMCWGLIQNNLISGNSWDWAGAGLRECSGTIQNNTIAGNLGNGVALCEGVIRNCIIWGNTGEQVIEAKRITHSCIEGWAEGGTGNVNADPRFADPAEGDYRLQVGSPCIDAGVNYYWFGWPQQDMSGNCRLAGKAVDIGCYEFGAYPDLDGDLLSDRKEEQLGTDMNAEDTDGDGLRDGLEVLRKSDPLVPTPSRTVQIPADMRTIQKALCLAVSGDEIIVARGTYPENLRFCGVDAVLRSTDPDSEAVRASTILDGGQMGSVVSFLGTESEACVLTGFTIEHGDAYCGGGIRGGTAAPTHATIAKNVIRDNRVIDAGGGLAYCDGRIEGNDIMQNWSGARNGGGLHDCNGTIRNNRISENSGSSGGGLSGCSGTIENNAITNNRASRNGGGLAQCYGTVENNLITGNAADEDGGGLYRCGATIVNNVVSGNSADDDGGGLAYCSGMIENNIISGNSAENRAGGLSTCGGTLQNNVIAYNSAAWLFGGLWACDGIIRNNTILGNSARDEGGGLGYCRGTILNCIIWGNSAPQGAQLVGCATPSSCCLQGWPSKEEGNLGENPRLVDPDGPDDDPATYEDNNYRLSALSPCIDAGENEEWMWTAVDLDGNPRIQQGLSSLTVDIGAYEYHGDGFRIAEVLKTAADETQLTWDSAVGESYTLWSCTDLGSGHWSLEAIAPSGGASTTWTDAQTGFPRKFYRIEIR